MSGDPEGSLADKASDARMLAVCLLILQLGELSLSSKT